MPNLQEEFRKYLIEQNLNITDEKDKYIYFEKDNCKFIFDAQDNTDYFRLLMPNVFVVDSNVSNQSKFNDLDDLNSTYRAAKFIKVSNNVWISFEHYVYTYVMLQTLFNKLVNLGVGIKNDILNNSLKTNDNEKQAEHKEQ